MRLKSGAKIWAWAVVCLVIAQMVASIHLPRSYRLTAITDWIAFVLMLSTSIAFARNAFSSSSRQRLVWILLGGGYAIEAASQLLWMHWELVVKQTPVMSLGDAGIYLAWTALILAFALRPHVELTPRHQRLGTLDLLLLLLWGLYLYLFLVIPWQYIVPEPQSYGPAYKYLALAQDMILLAIVLHGWLRSSGQWRYIYALLTAVVAVDTVTEYFVDTLSENGIYFSGSCYDVTTAACLAGMTFAALMANRLEPFSERGDPDSERYWRWAGRLAAPISLILPLLAAWSFLDRNLPNAVWKFRVVLSLVAIVVFTVVAMVKQARLQKELANANRELLDASLTDLLTGIRNRRYFANTIEADVQQAVRSFVSNSSSDLRNRDLVFYLIDVDHFKKVNDQFGHRIGDQVLVEVVHRLNSAARLTDVLIRWGGEEFLLLSRYTDRKEAHTLAKRVLSAVGSKPYHVADGKPDLNITCSIGWAVFPWKATEPKVLAHDQILLLADHALYQAKDAGRNQAVGLLPEGETVRGGTLAPAIFINGIPASPIVTPGPHIEGMSPADQTNAPVRIAVASATASN